MIDPSVLPDFAVAAAREYLTAHEPTPAVPRLAATTILLRGGRPAELGSVEVFLQRRQSTMAFAPSALVFPGGGVDPSDGDEDLAWVGPSPHEWAVLLDLSVSDATRVVCAAVRELFEEAGVLLAGADANSVVGDVSGPEWEQVRGALERREIAMSEVLRNRGLVIRTDLLAPWRCWLTPEFEPRRYLTHFFVALLPEGQTGRTASGESDDSVWMEVREALEGAGAEHVLLPPQVCTCCEFVSFDSAEEILNTARAEVRPPVQPRLVVDGDLVRLGLPDDINDLVRIAAMGLVR